MSGRIVTAKQFRRIVGTIGPDIEEALEKAALDSTLWGEARAVALTDEHGLVDQGHYKLAWSHRQIAHGAELRNDAPHAAVLEHGRRPGRPGPPLQPIHEWVVRKLVANGEVEAEDAEHVARLIRHKIHYQGSKPHGILAQVWREMRPRYRKESQKRIAAMRARRQRGPG